MEGWVGLGGWLHSETVKLGKTGVHIWVVIFLASCIVMLFYNWQQLELEDSKKLAANLERITTDFKQMKAENSATISKLKQQQTAANSMWLISRQSCWLLVSLLTGTAVKTVDTHTTSFSCNR